MATEVEGIDLASIEADISKLSKEELFKALVDIKSKQRIATKKYYNPETAKKQRQKRAAFAKALADKAKELGIYDEIVEAASEVADEALADAGVTA